MSARVVLARVATTALDSWDRVLPERVRRTAANWGLAISFLVVTVERTSSAFRLGTLAVDLRIYRAAAAAALHGGDPWAAGAVDFTFAAPPPALLPYLPAAVLPEELAILAYGVLSVVAAVAALRAVGLPMWWLLFPPLAESLVVLNSDVLVIALLLCGGRWAFASIVLKVYAIVPLLLERRWAAVVVGGLVCAVTLPLAPRFIADRELIASALDAQSSGGLSAWGTWLMVPTILALLILWRREAAWLAVPALWPYTQLHYNLLALPIAATSPPIAFLLSFAVWPLPAVATIAYALWRLLARYALDAAPGRAGAAKPAPST